MSVTVIAYVSSRTEHMAPFLADIFHLDSLPKELIVVDGGTMRVDFEKVGRHCRDNNIDFSVVRQDPLNRAAPGYHVAAVQAAGDTLVFINPSFSLPIDFLRVCEHVGEAGKILLLRGWMNVLGAPGGSQGFWGPPDSLSLVIPARRYGRDPLQADAWAASGWDKMDAWFFATRLAHRYQRDVGMATMGGLEYRRFMTLEQAASYSPALEPELVDVSSWVFNANDIRRYTLLHTPFERVAEPVPPFERGEEQIEGTVRTLATAAQARHQHLRDPYAMAVAIQGEVERGLLEMFKQGILVARPKLVVEPVTEGGKHMVRVRSAGVLLPHEHPE